MTIGPINQNGMKRASKSEAQTNNPENNKNESDLRQPCKKKKLAECPEEIGEINSADEHDSEIKPETKIKSNINSDRLGFQIIETRRDGSCLFRAVSHIIYGHQEKHGILRERCMDHIDCNWNFFKDFVTENKKKYIARKRGLSCHGNHVEIAALSHLLSVRIEIYDDKFVPITEFNNPLISNAKPYVRLCYRNNNHYDAIIDINETDSINSPNFKKIVQSFNLPLNPSKIASNDIEECYIKSQILQADLEETEDEILHRIMVESLFELSEPKGQNSKPTDECTNSVNELSVQKDDNTSPNF